MIGQVAKQPGLASLDLCEFSPPFDPHGECAKFVARMIYRFLVERAS